MILNLFTKTDIADRALRLSSFPFVFGREASELQTPPYASNDAKEQLKHISRKHATFEREQDQLFLTDNNSLNGTVVNGEKLGTNPRQLMCGDRIVFADRYDYVVDIEDDSSKEMDPPLQLQENSATGSKRTIEITTLPYLLERSSDAINSTDSPDQSRQHLPDRFAKIFYHDDSILFTSLLPDSGILLDSRPIPSGAHILNEGTTIQFPSGEIYTFSTSKTAEVLAEDQTVLISEPPPEELTVQFSEPPDLNPAPSSTSVPPEEDSTIYMNEATSFLNVFKENEGNTTAPAQKTVSKKSPEKAQPTQSRSPSTSPSKPSRKGWLKYAIGATIILTCLFTAVFYYRSTPEFVARSLHKNGRYNLSLLKINEILSEKKSAEFQDLGRKTLLLTLPSAFLGMLTEHDYNSIELLLVETRTNTIHIQDSTNIIDAMAFIAQVDSFFIKNKNRHRVSDESWKNETSAINKTWQKNKASYRPIYDEIIPIEPQFAILLQEFHKQLNDNREIEIYEVDEIEKVELTIRILAREKKFQQLKELIQTFNSSHPKLQGDKWLNDLDRYAHTVSATETANLFQLVVSHRAPTMETPLFADLSNTYRSKHYPADTIYTMLIQAMEQWQSGLAQESIATLSLCPPSPWTELIQQEIKTLQKITTLVEQAQNNENQEQVCQTVKELHSQTRDVDQYYRELFADISSKCKEASKENFQLQIQKANSLFFSYLQNHGINGQMRLEENISESFRQRAMEISQAYYLTRGILEESQRSNIQLSADKIKNIAVIQNEYNMQLTRLQESRVLSPALVQQKLDLFNQ